MKKYYFKDKLPDNYFAITGLKRREGKHYPVGLTAFEDFYTHSELKDLEALVDHTEKEGERGAFLPQTCQKSF